VILYEILKEKTISLLSLKNYSFKASFLEISITFVFIPQKDSIFF